AVTGGSYGGFMTNWIIGHTNRFCCAASQRSISNWMSMMLASDYGLDVPFEMGFEDIHNCTKEIWRVSPLQYANNCTTPTLFIHSFEDYRCPYPEGLQMFTAIRALGVEARMCLFKGENHELSRGGKPKHRSRRLKEITEWIINHTKE
ncbi:MAG: S9 family peptidase, partial [Erysipelotrichaceae bacterium]|nr:S9 family peptidase [Erysipelotrichaceae bacterium]